MIIEAPFLELQFFLNRPEHASITALVDSLLAWGARFAGTVTAFAGTDVRGTALGDVRRREQAREYEVNDRDGLKLLIRSEEMRIATVSMMVPTREGSTPAKVAVRAPDDSTANDPCVAALWVTGSVFSTPRSGISAEQRAWATEWVAAFLRLCDAFAPLYGAITVEEPLETPWELARTRRTRAASASFLGLPLATPDDVRRAAAGAYIEPRSGGTYVSVYELFNPGRVTAAKDVARQWSAFFVERIVDRLAKSRAD